MDDVDTSPAAAAVNNGVHVDAELSSPLQASGALEPVPALAVNPAVAKVVDNVLYSDIGVSTLLARLKQSIASARDLAAFFKARSEIEQRQLEKLRELGKKTSENVQRPESRQGTYAQQMKEVLRLHDRMAENSQNFSLNLYQMYTDLNQHADDIDRKRKNWKQVGLSAEKQAAEAEAALEKARGRYNVLAEKYDRARTGDSSAGRHFGLRGPKSAEQREEDLHRQVKSADDEYQAKVQHARQLRQDLLSTQRPETISALRQLIQECDAATVMQLQKLASQQELFLLRDGLLVAPPSDAAHPQKSMRDQVAQIDNDVDLRNYITSFSNKIPARPAEIVYEPHPALKRTLQPTVATTQPKEQVMPQQRPQSQPAQQQLATPSLNPAPQQPPSLPPQNFQRFDANFQQQSPANRFQQQQQQPPVDRFQQQQQQQPPVDRFQQQQLPLQQQRPAYVDQGYGGVPQQQFPAQGPSSQPGPKYPSAPIPVIPQGPPGQMQGVVRPSTRDGAYEQPPAPMGKMFGVSLDELFNRDKTPVPMVIIQCIQAVDIYGLDTEGIYRVAGSQSHVNGLRNVFDNDPYRVDFRIPEAFYHDVHVPASLLKSFLRELPDPLLTRQRYNDLIEAADIEDETNRRDSLHAIINDLPDPNYATLRALVLHLHRVEQHSEQNRMTPSNLAVIFGPTLLGPHTGDMNLAGLQPKVISTILTNALQIFDED